MIFKEFDFWSLKRVVGPFLMSKYRVWIDVATAAAAVRDRREREKWTLWCLAQLQKWPSKHNRTELREPERAFANSRICEAKHSTPTTQLLKCVPALYHQAWCYSKKKWQYHSWKKYRIPQNKWPISPLGFLSCFDTAVLGHSFL